MSNAPLTVTGLDRFFHYLSAQEQLDYLKELLVTLRELPQTTDEQDRATMLCLDADELFPRNKETEAEHEELMDLLSYQEGFGQINNESLNRLADITSVSEGAQAGPLAFLLKRRLTVALDKKSFELDPRFTGQFRA